jgi:hypothetical protein
MKRVASQRSKRLILALGLIAGLLTSIPVPEAQAANDVQASCTIGSSSSCPAQSPQEIYNLYGTTTNASYWLNVNGVATQTYLILDTSYPDGGMWFLGMKGVKGSTRFTYSTTYWTSQTTNFGTDSLSNDVAADAKFDAFNYLSVTKLLAVFKDRDSNAFNAAGSGDFGANSFLGHTWLENVSSTTMFSRFTTNSNITDAGGNTVRNTVHRETNSSSGKLVFPYQTGWTRYGFNNSTGYNYRWGTTSNNEGSMGSNDSGSGIGMDSYSAAGIVTYSDNLTVGPNGSSGVTSPGNMSMPSGFQIWGKMAAPSLATPGALSLTNQGSGSVQLSFAAASGATEYSVQYKTAGSNWNTGTTIRLTNPSATPSATLTGLASGSYDFRVFGRSANNSSAGNSFLLAQTIDATAPVVSDTTYSTSAGGDSLYGKGDSFTVRMTFSETVTVSGSPRIPIQGLTSKYFTYSTGSGSKVLDFTYVIAEGDLDTDGIAVTSNSLNLNGGSIKDLALNDASLNHAGLGAASFAAVDGVTPTFTSFIVSEDGTYATVTLSENLSATAPLLSALVVTVAGARDTVTAISITENTARLTLTFGIVAGNAVTFTYTDPTVNNDTNALQDRAGNDLATYSASVTNDSTATSNTFATIALNPVSTTAVFRASTSIRVSTNTAGRVDFYMAGKIIPGCRNIATSSNIATCSWKPAVHAFVSLTARFKPTGAGFVNTSTESLRIYVTKRSGFRG